MNLKNHIRIAFATRRLATALSTTVVLAGTVGLTSHLRAEEAFGGSQPQDALANLDFREVIQTAKAKVFPAVVYIKCVIETHEAGERKSVETSGSGVVISQDGQVLTNWHVIDKATSVRCLLSDGRAFDAEVIGSDKSIDFALIQLKLDDNTLSLPIAEFGASRELNEGDFVMAMGAPWGLNRSVSIGIVSCTRRFLDGSSEYSLWLQTDAAINPGNSGGPLVNTAGQIVGINTLGMTMGDNVGFSIPSETLQLLIPQIQQFGEVKWTWTGLQLQPLRDFNKDMYFEGTEGVIVAGVDPGSPAEEAGIKTRDRILSVNQYSLNALTGEDLPAVRRHLGLLPKDEAMAILIQRGEENISIDLTPREKGKVEGGELDCPRWDLTVKAINQFDNQQLYFYRQKGVFIFGIKYPGNASNSRLRDSDIIISIDNQNVESLDDIKQIHKETLDNIEAKHKIVFEVLRNGLTQRVVLDIGRDYSKE